MHSARPVGLAPMEQGGIFNRNFLVVALVNLFTMIAYYLLFVISSPYALERFHTSPSTAGLVAGLMVIGCLAGRFVTGRLLGLIGLRKTLFGGIVLYAGSIALYLVTDTLPLLFLVRFLSGVLPCCACAATKPCSCCAWPWAAATPFSPWDCPGMRCPMRGDGPGPRCSCCAVILITGSFPSGWW